MAHGDAREGKWRGNWRMEWVASNLHTTSKHGVSSITTADANTSAASSRLNWRPCRFKWTLPFRRKTKSGFCVCTITFQTQSPTLSHPTHRRWKWPSILKFKVKQRHGYWYVWGDFRRNEKPLKLTVKTAIFSDMTSCSLERWMNI
jgi:hypothetical protein